MWWIPSTIGAVGAVIKVLIADESNKYFFSNAFTPLEKNFLRLERILGEDNKGAIAFLGQPGSGKSALLNEVTNEKCEPRPQVGQCTDTTDWSISNVTFFCNYFNMKFIDTPGYDTLKHPVESYIQYFPFNKMQKVIFMVKGKLHQSDEQIYNKLVDFYGDQAYQKILIVRSFSDDISEKESDEILSDLNSKLRYEVHNIKVVLVSSRYGQGIKEVQDFVGI